MLRYGRCGHGLAVLIVSCGLAYAQGDAGGPAPEGDQPRERPGPEARMQRVLQMDADGDGRITRQEWQGPEHMFGRLDSDADGAITRQELANARRGPRDRGQRGGPEGRRGGAEGRRGGPPRHPLFVVLDVNKDGKITQEEIQELVRRLRRADKNGDGALDMREFMAVAPKPKGGPGGRRGRRPDVSPEQMLEKMDGDKNGKISREEWRGPEQFFDRLDADKDGSIDLEELKAVRERMRRMRGRGAGGPGGRPDPTAWFDRMDKDADGKVSAEEFTSPEAHFKRYDADGDGFITREELKAAAGRRGRTRRAEAPPPGVDF